MVSLDLDGTLIYNTLKASNNPTQATKINTVHITNSKHTFNFYIRPYTHLLLKTLSTHYEIIVFTASVLSYAKTIVDYINPAMIHVKYILYKEHCAYIKGLIVKDLRMLEERKLSNIIMLGNLVISFAYSFNNGIHMNSYIGDDKDKELLSFCLELLMCDHMKGVFKFRRIIWWV